MERRGAYVTLDGPDGVGKSNQAIRLTERSGSWLTREPGGHIAQIRDILLNPHIELTPEAEVLLFSADRNITLQRSTLPLLNAGMSVVSDRSFFSTLAYQCYGRGLDLSYAKAATKLALGDVCADHMLFLDAPFEVTQARLSSRAGDTGKDRFETEDLEYKKRVRNGFLELAKELGDRATVIDATGTIDETALQIFETCGRLLIEGIELK